MKRLLICLLLCLLLCSCLSFQNNYGHYVNVEKIKVGTTKKQLYEKVGKPSYYAANNDNIWYYIATEVNRYIMFPSYEFTVIEVTFDNNDEVIKVEKTESKGSFLPGFDSERTINDGIARDQTVPERILGSIKNLNPSLASK